MNHRDSSFIIISLMLAILLTIVSLPSWLTWLRPNFVLLILSYCIFVLDKRVGIATAFIIGIVLDIFSGTLLGVHALALVAISYIAIKLQKKLHVSPISQQAITIFAITIIYLIFIYWAQATVGQPPKTILFWLPALTNAFLWPWLLAWLNSWHRRFE